jgi:hypothetical protein
MMDRTGTMDVTEARSPIDPPVKLETKFSF